LLADAVEQRLDPSRPTSINLSGGYDSTAVYSVGRQAIRKDPVGGRELAAVSMSYPKGDPGREDETIDSAVNFCGGTVSWEDVQNVDLFSADEHTAAAARHEPVGHHFENWNSRLFRRAAVNGSRVVFTGAGGDQLFHVSRVYMADLVRSGRLLEAVNQWRLRGGVSTTDFARFSLAPLVPAAAYRALAALGGPSIGPRFDREPAAYFRESFVQTHGLRERDAQGRPRLARSSFMDSEMHASLLFPMVARTMGRVFQAGLGAGIEVRHPLLDERIVRFAMDSCWQEKADGRETKIVLRKAVAGLLPEDVLAARQRRTGESAFYFVRQMQGTGYKIAKSLVPGSVLADLGMIEPKLLDLAWRHFVRTGEGNLGFQLYHTMQTELWLRHHR
jgi:asparagine synthase (glutamine-hydrolysing)